MAEQEAIQEKQPEAKAAPEEKQPEAKAAPEAKKEEGKKEKKKEEKKEKQTNCLGCNKPLKKTQKYYRNGKYYCDKKCYKEFVKKTAKEAAEKEKAEKEKAEQEKGEKKDATK